MDCDNEEILYSKNKDKIEKIEYAIGVFENIEDYLVSGSNMFKAVKIADEILKEQIKNLN